MRGRDVPEGSWAGTSRVMSTLQKVIKSVITIVALLITPLMTPMNLQVRSRLATLHVSSGWCLRATAGL